MDEHKSVGKPALVVLSLFFLLGVAAGTALAFFSRAPASAEALEARSLLDFSLHGFFSSLYSASWLLLIAVLLSTSTVGHYLIPVLAFFRGYLIACCLTVMLLETQGSPSACLLIVGLPALFSLPAFFLLCEDGILTARLIRLCSRSGLSFHCTGPENRRLFTAAALLLISACAQQFLIPLIV